MTYELHDPPNRPPVKMPLSQSPAGVTFEVKRSWKGSPKKTVNGYLFTKPAQGFPFNFEVGQSYIVYSYEPTTWAMVRGMGNGDPVYALTDGCLRRVRSDVAKESRRLGESEEP